MSVVSASSRDRKALMSCERAQIDDDRRHTALEPSAGVDSCHTLYRQGSKIVSLVGSLYSLQ